MDDRHDIDEAAPMDPVAMTLALWLGLIVGVMGMVRLTENAAQQAAIAQAAWARAGGPSDTPAESPFNMRLMAFGG